MPESPNLGNALAPSYDNKPSMAFRLIGGVKGLRSTLEDLQRARAISSVLGRHGFGALGALLSSPRKKRSATDAAETMRELAHPDRGRRVLRVFEELGPTFIKFGQILSTRADILPPDIIHELQNLQDNVPPMSWADAEAVLERELGVPTSEAFRSIETEPLACASIAQVHRAILNNGDEAAVKIQRPNIRPQIRSDLHILHFIARRALAIIPELDLVDPVGIVTEFDKAISLELNFNHEREHILRFQRNFDEVEGIVIPRVYDELSTERVITMEYLRGYKATEVHDRLTGDPSELAPRMMRAIFKMIFEDGYFHGDLHPGNVLIQPDGTIGLIDFGLVGKLSERQRNNILDILIGISRRDYPRVARVFYDIGVKVPGQSYHYQRFEDDVVALMETHIGDKNIGDLNIGAFFADLVAGAIRHRIKMPPTYTMVFKALMTVEGMGKSMAPDVNFVDEATPFVRELLLERYAPAKLMRDGMELFAGTARFMSTVPPAAAQVLEDTARGGLTIQVRAPELSALSRAQQDDTRLLVAAVMTVGFVIAGTLAWDRGAYTILSIGAPTFIFFTIATLSGMQLFWRILRGRV